MYKVCVRPCIVRGRVFWMGERRGRKTVACWQLFGNFFCGKGEGLEAGDGGNT